MQDKMTTDIKARLMALAEAVKVKGVRGLAGYLEMKEGTLYAWINRGSIGDISTIVKKIPDVNIDFLLSGLGPVLRHYAAGGLSDPASRPDAPPHPSAAANGLAPQTAEAPPIEATAKQSGWLRPDQACILAIWEQMTCEQRGCLLALLRSLQGNA